MRDSADLYSQIKQNLTLISGPCVIENRDLCFRIASELKQICEKAGIIYIFKASFDKANRTSIDSFRGPGLDKGLKILDEISRELDLPVTTDIHEPFQASPVGEVADLLQIPAFLCRQTDLLIAAAQTGKILTVKKAQFLSAKDMENVVRKVHSAGNSQILLCERGNSFGYNNLVVDFRNLIDMQALAPTVMDITHSVQRIGSLGGKSGGDASYAPYFANAAAILGTRVFFVETHPDPSKALSDGPNMIPLESMKDLIFNLKNIAEFADRLRTVNCR